MGQVVPFRRTLPQGAWHVQTFGGYEQIGETRLRVYLFGRFVDVDFQLEQSFDRSWFVVLQSLVIVQIDRNWTLDDGTTPTEHHYIELASLLLQFAATIDRQLKIVKV